jgi:hypothetical protein
MATDCVVERCCQCGKDHERPNGSRFENFFCSRECSYKFKRHLGAHRNCTCCGKQIWCTSRKSKQRKVFCGNDCLSAFRKANRDANQSVPKERKPPVSKGRMTYGEWWPAWKRLRTPLTLTACDPWKTKFESIVTGCRHRRKDLSRPRNSKGRRSRTTWKQAFSVMRSNANQAFRISEQRLSDPWSLKFETMSRNWRRKAALMNWIDNESSATSVDLGIARD